MGAKSTGEFDLIGASEEDETEREIEECISRLKWENEEFEKEEVRMRDLKKGVGNGFSLSGGRKNS